MYYNVRLTWKQPKEGTDEMQKISKGYIVYAESCTEAEIRVQNWVPANYQDAVVEEVKKTAIIDLKIEGSSERFWSIKLLPESDKPKAFVVVLNANDLNEIVTKLKTPYFDCEVLAVQKLTQIIDEDLVSIELKPKPNE